MLETENDALPPDSSLLEVDEECQMKVRCAQIVDALGSVTFREVLYAFDFDQEPPVND